MRLTIKVISRAKKPRVQLISLNSYRVYVTAVREKGRANEALIQALAEYFRVPQRAVQIIRGPTSANKTVEIER